MAKTKILFFWEVSNRLQNYIQDNLEDYPDINLIFPEEDANYVKLANNCDALVGWRPEKELLEASDKLKLFINPGAGIKHLIPLFRELNEELKDPVTLVNGHGNSYFTAQHAVALLLSVTNKIIPHHQWMKEGKWRRGDDYAKSVPIRNMTIGLLGYGAINTKVHQFLSGFNVEFCILKRTWDQKLDDVKTHTPDEINFFLKNSDVVIMALPHTSETNGLIGEEELNLLGEDSLLINVARGDIAEEDALYEALEKGTIAGAGLDVWYNYSPEENNNGRKYPYDEFIHPFHTLDNVILSPHRGASPMDDLLRWDEVIENIKRLAEGRDDFINQVDLEREY